MDQYIFSKNQGTTTILESLVEKYYYREWSFSALSRNPNITWKFITKHPEFPWNYTYVSINPNITWEIIKSNPGYPWDYSRVARNPTITWDIVNNNSEWGELKYRMFSDNPNLTWDIIQQNLDKNWNWSKLASHPNISWSIISTNQKLLQFPSCVSANPNITVEIIESNPTYAWDFEVIALSNPNLTTEFIQKNMHRLVHTIFSNQHLSWDIIQILPDNTGTELYEISFNSNIDWNIITHHPEKPWSISGIARNPNITLDFISRNLYTIPFHELSFNLFSYHSPQISMNRDITKRKDQVHQSLKNHTKLYSDLLYVISGYIGYA